MSATIMVVDDEETARLVICEFLESKGYEVISVGTLAAAKDHLYKGTSDIIILDVRLPDGYGPNLLLDAAKLNPKPQIILITAQGQIEEAVEAMKNGAQDFILKPLDLLVLEKSVNKAEEIIAMRRELNYLRVNQSQNSSFIIGSTQKMKSLVNLAKRAAASSVSVLITGATGTGKEVLANFIHKSGPRADKPFIDVNSPGIQPTMFESELFGHEPGAFTSAISRKPGLMEVADGGVLFLDEIAAMPVDLQAKLLRSFEERSFRRVGGTKLINVDVQIIAASNRNLKDMMNNNEFREDLYYRLKVVDLEIPSLKERKEDIPELVGYFLKKHNLSMGANVLGVTSNALTALIDYDWPGNIRELSHAIEQSVLFCDEELIDVNNLPQEIIKNL